MLVLEDSDMIQLNNAAQYIAWKGQLYIHEQLVCDISLQTSSTCSIPAQLPEKLDLKEVIQLAELRKELPEDIFQKTECTGQEVFCGNIYYSFYPVIITNVIGSELEKVLKCMKDENLALIKVLNDQGFLILVNSAVLPSDTGIFDRNTVQLAALFLFPHQKFLNTKDREEWEGKFIRQELPLTVSNLLPGLHYAIIESSKLQKDKALYPAPLVEQYFKKYAVLQKKKDSSSERRSDQSVPLSLFYRPGDDLPQKCSPLAFSCLQLYISSPVNFSIPVIKMNNILAENALISSNADQVGKTSGSLLKQEKLSSPSKTAESKSGSARRKGKPGVREDKEQQSKKATKRKTVKRREKKRKKKSDKRAALTTADTSENQASNKRRRLLSEGKKQIGSSSEATVKLAHVPYAQRRKRGAEVLSAAIIQDDKIQTTEKITSSKMNEENKNLTPKTQAIKRKSQKAFSPEEHLVVPARQSKRKLAEPGKKTMPVEVVNKSEIFKRTSERNRGKTGRANKRSHEKMEKIIVEQVNTSGKSSESLHDAQTWPPPAPTPEDNIIEKRMSMYESHALNLLADLALNSFGSTSIPYLPSVNVAPAYEFPVEEAARIDDRVSTVEHPAKDSSSPAQSTTACTEAEHILASESDKTKNGLHVTPRSTASQKRHETGEKHLSQKAHMAAAKAKARVNATSKICLEHSYSQLPIEIMPGKLAKGATEQPIQGVPDSTTPADVVPEAAANGLPGEVELIGQVSPVASDKQKAAPKFPENFVITFNWEPNYNFDLDSRFTSDPLEKTINRALHGPWNPHLKEKVEDVKIILHMWIALFYSKSNKPIQCSSRKVVEHSNPAKYVSINTVLDPFEFYEIMETDHVSPAMTTNIILPMGTRAEALSIENPFTSDLSCKSGKTESVSLLTLPPLPTKEKSKETEHKYFRNFFGIDEEQKSPGPRANFSKTVSRDVTDKDGNVKESDLVGHTSHKLSDFFSLHDVTMVPISLGSHVTTSKLKFADKNEKYSFVVSNTIHRPEIPTTDDLNTDITNQNLLSVDRCSENNKAKNLVKDHELTKQIAESPSDRNDVDAERCMDKNSTIVDPMMNAEALKCYKDASKIIHVGTENNSTSESVDAHSQSELPSEEDFRQVGDHTENIRSHPKPQTEVLDLSKRVDYDSNCTEESNTVGSDDAQKTAMEDIPNESENLVEPKNTHELDENDLNKVEKPKNKATEKPCLTQNIDQSRFRDGNANFSNVTATDKGIKESDASKNMNQNLEESLSEASTKEDSSTHEKAGEPHNEACFENEPLSATANSIELDAIAIISTLKNLDIEDRSEISTMECEEHAHKDVLAESQNRLVSQAPLDVEKIQNSSCLGGTVNEVDLSGSAAKEIQIDDLSTKIESPTSQDVVNENVSLGTSKDTLDSDSDINDSNQTDLYSHIPSSFSDQLMRRYSEMDSVQPSEEKQQLDLTGDASPIVKSTRSVKESTHSSRSSSSNKKEILSKLKRICLGSVAGHQVSFENVVSGDENSINGFTNEKNEVMNDAKSVLPHREDESTLKNLDVEESAMESCNVEAEDPAVENCNVETEEPVMESCNVEAEQSTMEDCNVVEVEKPSKENCVVEDPANDKCNVEAEDPAMENYNVEAEEPTMENCDIEAEESAVENCDVVAQEPRIENCDVVAQEPTMENCDVVAQKPTLENCDVVAQKPTMENCDVVAQKPTIENCDVVAQKPTLENCDVVAQKPTMENCDVVAQKPTLENCDVVAEEPTMETFDVVAEEPTMETCDVVAEEPSMETCDVVAEEPTMETCDVVAEEPSIETCDVVAEEPTMETCEVVAEEPTMETCDVVAEEPTMETCEVVAEEPTMENCDFEAEEHTMENFDVEAEESIIDNSSPGEFVIINVNTVEPEFLEEVMPPQDNCLISPCFEDVSDSIEQDPSPKLQDICFIVNTGSISKEQYDRWSEPSDEDIEYIRSYTEPLLPQEHFQEVIPEPPSLLPEEAKCPQEQTTPKRTKKSLREQSDSNSGLYEADENISRHLQDRECNRKTNHRNVTVTKNIKDPGWATRTINKKSSRTDLDHVFFENRMASDDLTQNTLDMENLRFTCKLKDILRKSSTDKYIYGPHFQTMFDSRIPSCSHPTMKCRNPLLITVRCPYRRTDFRRSDSRHPYTYNSSPYYEDELWEEPVTCSRTIRKARTRYSPFHFSRLRYEATSDKSNSDISVILDECVQSNHLKLNSVGLGITAADRSSSTQLAEESGQQTRTSVPVSSKSQSVKNMISDLCTSLHSRLQTVARATEQKMYFYIYGTDDEDFISLAKSLLVKDGHIPTDPCDFLNNKHYESHQLLVMIKNEDVVSCINKIPYLMQLKLLHNVIFAGVDTPEDITESTYEELFQAGGFLVSDKSVLENITFGKLKEVLAVLEKMSRTSPWKWLIHYRENRKLKEDKRTEVLSQSKVTLLKSYQQSNIIEILPYHQCDSRSKEPSDDLACLLHLQYQHIHSRLAVYLTGATSTLTEEYEKNGFLVYDVETFLRKIVKVDSLLQASYRS
ncbi:protein TASOR 2 isoform 2-T3 [Anomaloglossus baeobatrachus]|uniref:protein TASOR 2 isoform X2 n=1 Tax=Anomaloglossus baeobatrachus TaxID=238106 RepID=UPI003F5053AE